MRTLTSAFTTALDAAEQRAGWLVHLALDSGDVRLWSGIGDLAWSGDTYQGVGHLGAIEPIRESPDLASQGLRLTLSGIPSSLVSIALGEHYQGRAARVWYALFDSAWALIADPVQVFGGRVDVMRLADGAETATIELTAENVLAASAHAEPRFYTDADQQAEYPGDQFFEFVPEMVEKTVVWGGAPVSPGTARPPATAPAGEGESSGITVPAWDPTTSGIPNQFEP